VTVVQSDHKCRTVLVVAEYDKKKYVWKLLYIYMLGYDVEFGHKQAADLIPATK
jgi:AP-2 complex subunit alpha